MKTNGYLGLISLQIAATNLQHNRLAKEQAERDAEQQRLTQESTQIAQNAHYAQWRQTPDGRHFETWRDAALDITATARNRNNAWRAIWDATLAAEISAPQHPADVSRPKRRQIIAAAATGTLWIPALFLVGLTDPNSIAANIGTGFGVLSLIPLAIVIISSIQISQLRTTHEANNRQAAHQAHAARYGSASIPSWHPHMNFERVGEVTSMIDSTITNGPRDFPAPNDLQPLRPLLATSKADAFPTTLPSEARQLLEVFAQEDTEKRGRLEATQLT